MWGKTVERQRLALARGGGLRAVGTPSLPHKLSVGFLRCALGLSGQISTCIEEGALDQGLISSGKEKKNTPITTRKSQATHCRRLIHVLLGVCCVFASAQGGVKALILI